MRKKISSILKKTGRMLLMFFVVLLASCTDGYDGNSGFSAGVTDSQLESPDANGVTVTPISNQSGNIELKITWPVVYGAGGYSFTLYNVDDPDNPVVVGEAEQLIDGCTVRRERADDTKYKIVVKTLGNTALNNTGATIATEVEYTTLIPVYETIPSGTDLGDYFATNSVPAPESDVAEVIYALEADGVYTMKSDVALKSTNITLRGDKVHHPQIKVSGDASFVSDGAGFKIRWADFDLEEYTGSGFIQYNPTMDATNPNVVMYGSDVWIVVKAPSGLESCKITNLKNSLIKDNSQKYALKSFTFSDCIVEQAATAINPFINFTGAIIKDLSMINSTFYCLNKSYSSNWIVFANVRVWQVADREIWKTEGGSININNSTFWQVAYSKQFYNCNGWAQQNNSVTVNFVTVTNSIFVDTGNKEVLRRIRMSNIKNVGATYSTNTYWYDGAIAQNELDDARGDKTGTSINADPSFANPTSGDFTVGSSAQKDAGIGDPRWLP